MTDEPEVALATEGEAAAGGASRDATVTTTTKRRRRRGGRGRGRSPARPAEAAGSAAPTGEEPSETAEPAEAPAEAGEVTPARRRRRRGGRGRGRKPGAAIPEAAGEGEAPSPEEPLGAAAEPTEGEAEAEKPKRTRSRRPRKKPAEEAEAGEATTATKTARATKTTAKPATKTRSRTKARAEEAEVSERAEEPRAGSTRLLRSKARGRTARTTRRRREATIVLPRVTDKLMVITEHGDRDQIAVLEGRDLVQHFVTRSGARSMVGNVYIGQVQNVLPGMEAAFVDIGRGRNAVLYAGEVNYSPEDLEGGQPRIEQVLRPGQSVLVQVTKDPMGGKGARLTAQISMPGRYLVLVPNTDVWGISRRLSDAERRRLKTIARKIKPEGHGSIVRTAAEGAPEDALTADLERLVRAWTDIEKRARRAKPPTILYEEPELTVRVVRDLFTDEEFRELVTDSPRVHERVTEYLRDVAPDLAEKVTLRQGKLPVFEEFHIAEQIHKALDRKVWLPSGGYVVIERTEAMTVIDVNTGKHVGGKNLEETVTQTNLEAATEIARQLRLRDIGGIIIVDFIDMLLEQNKQRVIDTLTEALAHDKTRSQVFDIGPLGLLEVTRKRVSGGLLESFSETCPTCEGRGILVKYEIS